ncbi:hypothetical protein [Actinophytocola sp. NPDC049390]|uniref:hypothetical protein n=1 Tax=Actinophytocola sp. NPDC049390 TaxID=3363894 RepID=UPI00378C98DF
MTAFFTDFVLTGTVLGLDHTSAPDEVHAVLGGSFEPPLSSFGLIEFGWRGDGDEWKVQHFGVQAHRLVWLADGIEPALVARYGDFPARVDVDDLREAVTERGAPLEAWPRAADDYVAYGSSVAHVEVLAHRETRTVESLFGMSPRSPWWSFPGQEKRFASYARHLLTLTAAERAAWFARREPEAHRADWWACLIATAARKTHGARQWQELTRALRRAAAERGVHAPN